MARQSVNVGVLAIHGGVVEHFDCLKKAAEQLQSNGHEAVRFNVFNVTKPEQVNDELDGLILPGGESTVLTKHLSKNGFLDHLRKWTKQQNKFTWGTCAGFILLSNQVSGHGKDAVSLIGGLDVTIVRNAFGRQINSFEGELLLTDANLANSESKFQGVFIRAPGVKSVDSDAVSVLCRFPDGAATSGTGESLISAVGVRQGNVMGCTFHPELTEDTRWHKYFLAEVFRLKYN